MPQFQSPFRQPPEEQPSQQSQWQPPVYPPPLPSQPQPQWAQPPYPPTPQLYRQPPQQLTMQPGTYQSVPPSTQPPRNKRRERRKTIVAVSIGFSILIIFAAIGVIGWLSSSKNMTNTVAQVTQAPTSTPTDTPTVSPTDTPTQAPQPTATPTPKLIVAGNEIGKTITLNGVSCTLVSVKHLGGDEFIQPKAGNIFIVVRVQIVNNSGSEVTYSFFDFHVKSGSGNITDAEFVPPSSYTANKTLDTGKLSDGGSVEGDIIFQVPQGDHKVQLTWQLSYFGNTGDNTWLLGL